MLKRFLPAFVVVLALVALACGGDGDDPDPDGTQDAQVDFESDSLDDSGVDLPEDIPDPDPEFTLGINEVYETNPQAFTALEDGMTVPIILGPQGSNMVVLAFRTTGIFSPDARLHLTGSMSISGMEEGTLQMTEQEMLPGGDGYQYFYNFWLAIQPVEVPTGEMGTITFLAEDLDTGLTEERTVNVIVGAQQ